MADNETIANVIAWMKELSAMKRDAVFNAPVCYSCETTIAEADLLDELIPKLEAAHKRERGDCAKLREALELIVNKRGILDFCHNNLGSKKLEDWDKVYKTLRRWIDKAMSALSSPPRNCDRFAIVDEARKAHEAICEKYGKCHNGCPLNNEEHYSAFDCFEAWLFAPATEKEGGNDENE